MVSPVLYNRHSPTQSELENAMKALLGACARQTPRAVSRNRCRPVTVREFRAGTIWHNDEPDRSQEAPADSDSVLSNFQVDAEKKTVSTATGELPVSPLMDPSFHKARRKFIEPKPTHSGYRRTKFQQQLARNPYAKALATPVRRCPITDTSLPSFFLERFNLVSHPDTGKPWFLPDHVNKLRAAEDGLSKRDQAEPEADSTPQEPPEDGQERAKGSKGVPKGPSAYVLSRQTLLRELQTPRSPYFRHQQKLLRMSDHGQARLTAALNAANWHTDMDMVLLELLRRRAVEGLRHFANMVEDQGRKYIVKCEGWAGVKGHVHRGCLLYLGPPEESSSEPRPEHVPPRLSTIDVGPCRYNSTLAVHNLRDLLGEEHLGRLRRHSELLRDGSLFMLGRQATVNLHLLLWKLQGYMAWGDQQTTSEAHGSK
ncbi:hypothetical protein N658DRAFT_497611 [Parathielavia hyrcaniae]|uniref:Uncharacterized protein n=1 Tax=Parathielavia hyrcaniae TaxID=113614 RepID=A0AAN6Q0P1_9PEZI|nr:hypothetical protein N658DRAFT_497611 [Parathielavia hyrcaniae]